MIDDKKIEEAANLHRFELIASMHGSTLGTPMQCFEEVVDTETDLIENSFITGAKWAINEFLEELWHPASEEPNREGKPILFNCVDHFVPSWCVYPIGFKGNWNVFCNSHGISKWLYIDDLLPKEGGEQ